MATEQDWESLVQDDKFVKFYKTGENITSRFAYSLLDQSGLVNTANNDPSKPLVVLDNACGTGIVSSILHNQLDDAVKFNWKLICGDISPGMVKITQLRMENERWQNTEVKIVDAQDTKLPSDHFTHTVTAFAFMALPNALTALDDMKRILQPGGTIAFSTWKEPGWVSVFQKAIETIPGDLPFPSPAEFLNKTGNGRWNSTSWIESQLQQRGFVDTDVKAETRAISLEVSQFVNMSMIMFTMVAKHFWTEEQRKESIDKVQPALEKYLTDVYGENGEIPMEWTAILSTGRKEN